MKSLHSMISSKIEQKDLSAIRGALRQAFTRSNYKKKHMDTFKVLVPRYTATGKLHKKPYVKYKCERCEELFSEKDINLDHTEKVGSFKRAEDIQDFFFRIWCLYDNLKVLCVQCHDDKTLEEKAEDRAKKRKEKFGDSDDVLTATHINNRNENMGEYLGDEFSKATRKIIDKGVSDMVKSLEDLV